MENDRKWIYLAYVVLTALVAWVLHKIFALGLDFARQPNFRVLEVMPISGVAGIVIASVAGGIYFSKENVNTFSLEVLQELKKVTWPMKKMAYMSTIVVIVLVVIMSMVLGFFDWITNKVVGLLLQV